MRKSQIPIILFTLLSLPGLAQVACPTANPITVTRTTGSAGTNGSLPWAITCLNNVTTLTTIQFSIPGAGPHIILPGANSPLPTITKSNAHIDGSTDNIVIDGSSGMSQGLIVSATNNVKINGLTLRNFNTATFPHPIGLNTGDNHEITSCQIFDNVVGISVARSVGVFDINLNYIGVDKSNTNFSNSAAGIAVETYVGRVIPTGNISNNVIGQNSLGVQVGDSRNVVISKNSIYCNSKGGIDRLTAIATPTFITATTRLITGSATALSTVEVFRVDNTGCTGSPCQGKTFLGSATANIFGNWSLSLSSGLANGDQITATRTSGNNTTEFSVCRAVVDVCANFQATIKSNNVSCNLGTNGSASVSTSGGLNQGIGFVWSTGATTSAISNLKAGTYTVTASDAGGCQDITTVIITEPLPITIRPSVVNVACNGDKSGQITTVTSGGTPPYGYSWSNGATTANLTGLIAGTYNLTVTDFLGCKGNVQATITQPTPINIILGATDTLCAGAKTGTASASVSGGTPGYTFLWSTGATTPIVSNLSKGSFGLTVTDKANCLKTINFSIAETAPLQIDSTVIQPKCAGDTLGEITIKARGGTAPYSYIWDNGATTASRKNLKAGVYKVGVTDARRCTNTWVFTLTDPAPIRAQVVTTSPACFGLNTGTAKVDVLSNTGPHTFLWSTGATTTALENLPGGSYGLTITNANGCRESFPFTINAPTTDLKVLTKTLDINCFGESSGGISTSTTGGKEPYLYRWSTGASSMDLTLQKAGTYGLTVTDQSGCVDTTTATIKQNSAIVSSITASNPLCFGQINGQASVLTTGGSPAYRFLWSNGATSSAISNLGAGKFVVTITDALGCTKKDSTTLITPNSLQANASSTNVTCNAAATGTAQVLVSGGTSPYSYAWSNGATTSAIANLPANTYGLTVSDSKACQTTATVTVTQPPALSLVLNSTDIPCGQTNTGQASVVVSGGTSPYQYVWSNGATTSGLSNIPSGDYSVTITDANGCKINANRRVGSTAKLNLQLTTVNSVCSGQTNGQATILVSGGTSPYRYLWSNGATTSALTNLAAGNYPVTITDALGCNEISSANLITPTELTLSITPINLRCNSQNEGQAMTTVGGGTAPYTYVWSNGATTSAISNLPANTYGLTVSDSKACQTTATATVTQPPVLNLILNATDIPCGQTTSTGQVSAVVSGGTSPYQYAWSNGATTSALSNIPAGDYSVTITDANGCKVNNSKKVSAATKLTLQFTANNILCDGQSNGQATVLVSGGTSPYRYLWSNGATSTALSNLAAGNYAATITDAAACSENGRISVTAPAALTLNITPTNLRCNGQNQGQALAAAGGGTSPYTYRWSNGATTSSVAALAAGNFSLTLTDANSCTISRNFSITQPLALQANATFTQETSPNASNGTATATAAGGTSPYRFSWSNGATTAAITGLAKGVYTVTVEDANGCTSTRSGSVGGESCPALSVSGIATDLNCAGGETGAITLSVLGGTSPYLYNWSNGETTTNLKGLNEGTYTVTVSDSKGCTGNYTSTLKGTSRMPKPLYGIVAPDTVCGNETFSLRADDLFQGPKVTYVWQLPTGVELTSATPILKLKATSSDFSGEYTALRDSAGCRSSIFGPVIVDVVSLPPNSINAGRDTTLCKGTSVTLKAKVPASGKATWLSLSNRVAVQNPNSPTTNVQNLEIGANRFVWRIAIGKCIQAAADTVTVFLEKPPKLTDDKYTIERAQDVAAMNILLNDELKGIQDTTITWSGAPTMGTFEYIPGNKSFRYTSEADFRGVLRFQYIVCNQASACAVPCDTANVTIDVFNLPKPTEGMVLDDPGLNGTLQIRGLQGFSRIDIVITNRWGDLVYRNDNYDNNAPWRGHSGDNGPFLPPGAYYYVIRAYDNESLVGKPQTGAIYLFKKENP